MSTSDLQTDIVYTDKQGRFRKIIGFFDGFDGERRVQYEAGWIRSHDGKWHKFETRDCSKKSFARWAKDKLRQGE